MRAWGKSGSRAAALHTGPSPFFVNIVSKGVTLLLSPLDATLTGRPVDADSKRVRHASENEKASLALAVQLAGHKIN